jgi:pimeloyl-ACP methyl ester carboxylesterase
MRLVPVGSLVFDVEVAGPPDGVPVLLLHGFPQYHGMWDQVLPALHAAGCRTIAPDQRGYSPGARPPEVGAYTMADCVADAASILDHLEVAAAHVVGHDWGALVAWQLAARRPQRVFTLTAISVPHPLAVAQALATDEEQRRKSRYISVFRQPGSAEDLLLADQAQRLRALFEGCPAQRIDRYVQRMQEPGALTPALNWYRAMSRADTDGLGPVGLPTTYLWGQDEGAVSRSAAVGCAEFVTADYRFVEVPEGSHWLPDAAPELVAQEVVARVDR